MQMGSGYKDIHASTLPSRRLLENHPSSPYEVSMREHSQASMRQKQNMLLLPSDET
jgi:hypothetical protein